MNKFTKILALALIVISATSCLKDKGYEDDRYGINVDEVESIKIVNIPSTNTTLTVSSPQKTTGADVTLSIPVHLSAKDAASEDLGINLTVDADDAKINAYNATLAAASRYVRMPATGYALNGAVKIASGTRDGSATITLRPNTLPVGRYIIPVSITGIDKSGYTISGNQGYRLILVVVTA